MKKPNALLAAMGKANEPEPTPVKAETSALMAEPAAPKAAAAKRAGQKHLGAYFDKVDPILERVAILRARLDMTNSELIEHALNELWARHEADRKFGQWAYVLKDTCAPMHMCSLLAQDRLLVLGRLLVDWHEAFWDWWTGIQSTVQPDRAVVTAQSFDPDLCHVQGGSFAARQAFPKLCIGILAGSVLLGWS